MCDICFMRSLDLHFTCLRSFFSLIVCWLISSQVISLTPLDLSKSIYISQNPSRSSYLHAMPAQLQGELESLAQGPKTPDCPDTPALRSDTPNCEFLVYIPRGSGWTIHSLFLLPPVPPLYLSSFTLALWEISIFPPLKARESLKEGSPLRNLRGGFRFEVPALSTVSKGTMNFESYDLSMP